MPWCKGGALRAKRTILSLVGIALIALALWRASARWPAGTQPVGRTRFLMGTSVTVKVFASTNDRAERLVDRAFDEMARIEALMSAAAAWDSTSRVRVVNAAAGSSWVFVGPELAHVLGGALRLSERSHGEFDVTVAPLSELWGFSSERPRVPSADEIRRALPLVGYEGLHLEGDRARLDRKGMALDLGGIAKGYAVDQAVALLRREGAKAALVEAGGDLAYFGRKPGNVPWRIAVQHPRQPHTYIAVDSPYEGVATSGDYQRCMVVDGHRYHHILDPHTGYPASGVASVTVWTTSAMDADALATAVFVMGPEEGMALVEALQETEALLLLERDGALRWRASSGLRGRVRFPQGLEQDRGPSAAGGGS